MRIRALTGASALAIFLIVASSPVDAESSSELAIALEATSTLVAGDRAEVIATLRLPTGNDRPLLLSPRSEGTAIEVVRGRLLRSDADDPSAEPLRFRIAIVAREPGDAILRVRVVAYQCAIRCETLHGEASLSLRVSSPERSLADRL